MKKNKFVIESIGNRLLITGDRGKWDVMLDVKIEGYPTIYRRTVRSDLWSAQYAAATKWRDSARELKDSLQEQLARGESIYLRVEPLVMEHLSRGEVVYPSGQPPETLEVNPADFDFVWKPPKNRIQMISRKPKMVVER